MNRHTNILLALGLAAAMALLQARPASALDQALEFVPGWNLISLWVEPDDSSVEAVFGALPTGRLLRVYGYDGNSGEWMSYDPTLAPEENYINTLSSLSAGVGYWVLLSAGPDVEDYILTGRPATSGPRMLAPGWHLLGFNNRETLFWSDALGSLASAVAQAAAYDPSREAFYGFSDPVFEIVLVDDAVDDVERGWTYGPEFGVSGPPSPLRKIEPGQALWVELDTGFTYGPVLELETESDADAPPFVVGEKNTFDPMTQPDTDINGNGMLDYGFTIPGAFDKYGNPVVGTQDTVSFREPTGASRRLVNTQVEVMIRNAGSGVLQFEASTDAPQVSVEPSSGEVLPGEGAPVFLNLDLAGLAEGEHSGTFTVISNGGTDSKIVKILVPPIDGRYRGSISIAGIGETRFAMGRWPVEIEFLSDSATIDASGSLHFAGDVSLAGSIADGGFDLAGEETLAADNPANPYGAAITRTIALVMDPEQSANTVGGQLGLNGGYRETITGLGPEPIELFGFFSLLPVEE